MFDTCVSDQELEASRKCVMPYSTIFINLKFLNSNVFQNYISDNALSGFVNIWQFYQTLQVLNSYILRKSYGIISVF